MDISVVVACKNEEAFIVDCVQSILASIQFAGVDGEVLVYDGISTDNTWFLVDQLSKKDQRVKGHINDEQTAPFAFNKGIRAAESPVIMIFGAHATMGQTHISEVLETLKSYPDAGCVGGLINNIYHDDLGRAIGEAMNSKVGVGNATFRTGGAKGYVDTVAFGAYKKEVFEQIGLFNT